MSRWSSVERLSFEALALLISGDDHTLRRRLSISARQLARARTVGVSVWHADEWAMRAGFHPNQVWGLEWEDAIDRDLEVDYEYFDWIDEGWQVEAADRGLDVSVSDFYWPEAQVA